MLAQYRDAINTLPLSCRRAIIRELGIVNYPKLLYDVLYNAHVSQADIVLALLRTNTPESIAAAELMTGKPIKQCPKGLLDPCAGRSLWAQAQWVLSLLGDNDDRVIVDLKKNNRLKNTGAHARFKMLKIGMSVQSFLSRGGTRRDLREWQREGSVKLS